MNVAGNALQAAVVVKWPHHVPLVAARELCRRLVDAGMGVTWALDQVSQIEALASWGAVRSGSEAALLVEPSAKSLSGSDEPTATQELTRRLELLRSTGMGVEVIQASGDYAEGQWPRTLRALGVSGLLADGGGQAGLAHALPFGVWQFTPCSVVPHVRRWMDWLRTRRPLLAPHGKSAAVVSIDLTRAGMPGSRPWREAELAVAQISQAEREDKVGLHTLGQIATGLCQANSPRPQRSILRAAA